MFTSASATILANGTVANNAPTITSAVTSGSVTELPDNSAGENTTNLTSTGTISFADTNLTDSHTTTVTPAGSGYRGSLVAPVTNVATGDGSGVVTWTYTVNDSALDDLTAGQTLTQTYTVRIDDGHGGQVSRDITITLTGASDATSNSAPTITSAVTSGGVTELPDNSAGENTTNLTQTGAINFADTNLTDSHTVTVTAAGSGYRGSLVAPVTNTATGDGSGVVTWTYTVNDSALDDLTAGQTLTQIYTITINDGHGGQVSRDVTITLTGASDATPNSAPTITSAVTSGSVTELPDNSAGENTANLTAAGTINFADTNLTDSHTTTVTPAGSGYRGSLIAPVTNVATGDGSGVVTWTYTVNDSALDDLTAGQTLTQTYTVRIDDGHGGQVSRDVTITLTGASDATLPQVSISAVTSKVTEGGELLYHVNISSAPAQPITVHYNLSGSANYDAPSGAVTFAAGQTDQFISVQTRPDADQDNEALTVTLQSASQYAVGTASATSTVTDISHLGGRIFVEGGDISDPFLSHIFGHLFLVYQTAANEEYVIRGGPSTPTPQSPQYGLINVENSWLLSESADAQNNTHGRTGLDLGGRDASDVWSIMVQAAEQIDKHGFSYSPVFPSQNSNNVVGTLLHAVDTNPQLPGPILYLTTAVLDMPYTLVGTAYDDHLSGGPSSDRLEGGAGNDTYYFSRNSGDDTISDTGGSDTIYYHGDALGPMFSPSGDPFGLSNDLIGGLSGPDRVGNNLLLTFHGGTTITIENYFAPSGTGPGTGRIETFVDGNEVGVENGFDTTYYFDVGTGDLLRGQVGSSSYVAVPAHSTASNTLDDGDVSAAQSSVSAADGPSMAAQSSVSMANGPSVAMLASVSASDDPFDDWLFGADGADILIAHDGDDVLFGGAGNDQLAGGAGNDLLDGGADADRLDGGPDTASSGGLGDTALYAFAPSGVSVSLATGSGTRGDAAGDTLIAIENLVGSEFADDLIGNAGTNLLLGLGGDDFLDGGAGADGMGGGLGNDTLIGGGGNDFIDGGEDTDTAVYAAAASTYTLISYNGTVAVLTHGTDGDDRLQGIENIQFADMTVAASAAAVFDPWEYLASNGDLIHAFGANPQAGFDHYVNYGFLEGRATHSFDALEYIASNPDLIRAFGDNPVAGEEHYVKFGFLEGRATHSFDALEYIASNPDLIRAIGDNPAVGEEHYVKFGFLEGRATHSFDAIEYIASNPDLARAFGANPLAGEEHYVKFGFLEGRATHSFDPLEYIASNPDLIQAFGDNPLVGEEHYVRSAGFLEGRAAIPSTRLNTSRQIQTWFGRSAPIRWPARNTTSNTASSKAAPRIPPSDRIHRVKPGPDSGDRRRSGGRRRSLLQIRRLRRPRHEFLRSDRIHRLKSGLGSGARRQSAGRRGTLRPIRLPRRPRHAFLRRARIPRVQYGLDSCDRRQSDGRRGSLLQIRRLRRPRHAFVRCVRIYRVESGFDSGVR